MLSKSDPSFVASNLYVGLKLDQIYLEDPKYMLLILRFENWIKFYVSSNYTLLRLGKKERKKRNTIILLNRFN